MSQFKVETHKWVAGQEHNLESRVDFFDTLEEATAFANQAGAHIAKIYDPEEKLLDTVNVL